MDLLEDLFRRQAALNDAVFEKRSIRGEDGRILSMADLFAKARAGEAGPPSDTARWIAGYLRALMEEGQELSEEIPWKWWSKENLDMEAIRVEVVDMLHFWISLALSTGMDAKEVHRLYLLKNEVNHRRQEAGYDASAKTGRDDLHVR